MTPGELLVSPGIHTKELNIRASMFTGNPMAIVGADGYKEAELANAFGLRVYERKKNTVFKDELSNRKRRVRQGIAKATRLVERSMAGRSLLCCERFELACTNTAVAMSLNESDQAFQYFLEQLSRWDTSHVVAMLWFRDHLSEIGYRYHLVLLVDAVAVKPGMVGVAVGIQEIWSTATRHKGIVFQHSFHSERPRTWGIGLLAQGKSLLMDSIAMMLSRDLYFRVLAPPEIEHFGISKPPSAIKAESNQVARI